MKPKSLLPNKLQLCELFHYIVGVYMHLLKDRGLLDRSL